MATTTHDTKPKSIIRIWIERAEEKKINTNIQPRRSLHNILQKATEAKPYHITESISLFKIFRLIIFPNYEQSESEWQL